MRESCSWTALSQLSGEKLISGLIWFIYKVGMEGISENKTWIIWYPLHTEEVKPETTGHPCSYLGWESVWRVSNECALGSHRKKQEQSHQVSNKAAQTERPYTPSNHTDCERDTEMWKEIAEGCSQNHSWPLWDLDREHRYKWSALQLKHCIAGRRTEFCP